MEKIRFITDSASDMNHPREDVTILPLHIRFGDDEYADGVTISHREFYEKLIECDTLPTTSLISPAVFEDAYEQAVSAGETVIVITISGKLSGTCQSARIAAEDYEGKVFVVDSMNATIGERILVEYGLQLKDQGKSAEEIVSILEKEKSKIHTMGLLDTLEYLKKGGRISSTVAFIGGALAIKPVVAVSDGEIIMLGKARGSKNAEKYPTPFHIYDEKGIRENAKALKEAFAWNKGYKEFFAVKATPNPFLINILREYGCGCDCSSLTELMLSNAMGVKGEDIMFSSNDTPAHEFEYAAKIGATINLDDITHIDFLEKTIGYLPKTLSCRYNPGGYFSISNNIMDNPGDAKYGFTTEQMFEGYKILKAKGVENFGIHSFLASNTVTNDYYPTLARELFELAVKLKEETGAHITFINLSGGIGIPYRPDQEPNDIRAIGEGVRKVYEEVLVPAGMGDVAIYTELGRYMMAPYGHLVTQVIHEKHTHKEYIGVDACAVNLMRPAMYGAYHHITVLGKENEPCDHKYDVTGSLCENNDKFAIDRMLPKIDIGDYIAIHDTGAHGFAMGYNYNGKLKSAELLLKEDGIVELIRRAETPKDYFATFDCFDIYNKIDFDA